MFIVSMPLSLLWADQIILLQNNIGFWSYNFQICLYISFNATATTFENGFTEHLGKAIIKVELVGFLSNLGVQYTLDSFLFISLTSILYLFFRNDVLSDKIWSTGLIAFNVDVYC